jgi:mono/diheme cytochrome c family protein
MRVVSWSNITALGIFLAMATTGQAAPEPDLVARGKAVVTRNCAGCHAVGASGDSPNVAAPRFRQLNERYDVEALAEGLAEGLTVGHGPMPEWTFPPEDVTAIVAYLKSIQSREGATTVQPRPLQP